MESGEDGLYFLPFDLNRPFRPNGINPDFCRNQLEDREWQRWLLLVEQGAVRGHASLKSDPMDAGRHRCELGMGIESAARGSGFGSALLDAATEMARSSETLEWLDLRVMAVNAPAVALYQSRGFIEIGRVRDRFRIGVTSIDEILMTLNVKDANGCTRRT